MTRLSTRQPRPWREQRIERLLHRIDKQARGKSKRGELADDVASQVPALRSVCERANLSHWRVSRVLGPGNWPLLYLGVFRRWSQRRLADAWGVSPSLICRRLQRLRSRIQRAGYHMGPKERRKRQLLFSDCNGENRAELMALVGDFERFQRVNKRSKWPNDRELTEKVVNTGR